MSPWLPENHRLVEVVEKILSRHRHVYIVFAYPIMQGLNDTVTFHSAACSTSDSSTLRIPSNQIRYEINS